MRINLSPQRRDDVLEVIKSGDSLIINGEIFDFTPLGVGDTLPASAVSSEWFWGDIDRTESGISLTLFLPLPWNFSQEQAFPVPLDYVPDGPVVFPSPLPEPVVESAPEVIQ